MTTHRNAIDIDAEIDPALPQCPICDGPVVMDVTDERRHLLAGLRSSGHIRHRICCLRCEWETECYSKSKKESARWLRLAMSNTMIYRPDDGLRNPCGIMLVSRDPIVRDLKPEAIG